MSDQEVLRERLKVVLMTSPRTIADIAREVDASRDLVGGFISGKRKTHFMSLLKLEAWVQAEENRLGITV